MTIFVGYLEVSFEVKFLSYSLFCFFYSYYIQYHLISIVFFHDLLLLCCFVTIYSLVDHLLNLSACSFSLHFLFIKTFCTFSTVKFTPINNHMLYARNRNAWEKRDTCPKSTRSTPGWHKKTLPSVFADNTEQIPLPASLHQLPLEQVLVFWDLECYLDQFCLRRENMPF